MKEEIIKILIHQIISNQKPNIPQNCKITYFIIIVALKVTNLKKAF